MAYKDEIVSARVEHKDLVELKRLANIHGVSLSDMIRIAIKAQLAAAVATNSSTSSVSVFDTFFQTVP